ncbi:hypothetical protein LT85_4343 [Collimonas arenae]|uniref:Uncharacterized protein n=1 Tax=Collimonas arenae TaxID=279058 RepID=A0A0A1FG33_9BURK|nr:hypothetical protein LT85_4343 [Collimonas arenae]
MGVILILRNSNSSQNSDNRNNDHQFDQGKTALCALNHFHRFHLFLQLIKGGFTAQDIQQCLCQLKIAFFKV